MVIVRGSGINGYIREFHHQMNLNYPKCGKIFLFWPVLWIATLIRFIYNNRKIRKTTSVDILKKAKSTYQQLTVSEDMLQDKTLILQSFPTTFFVDKDGNIVDSIEGSNDYDGWKAKIDEVLEKVMTNE